MIHPMTIAARLLRDFELAARLGVPTRAITRMVRDNGLPHVTLPGGHIRFEPDAVARWIAERRSEAAKTSAPEATASTAD